MTMHEYKTIMTPGTHCECTTNHGFTHVSFVRNVAHVSSRDREFLNRENFAKAKTHHSGKFVPMENNPLHGI